MFSSRFLFASFLIFTLSTPAAAEKLSRAKILTPWLPSFSHFTLAEGFCKHFFLGENQEKTSSKCLQEDERYAAAGGTLKGGAKNKDKHFLFLRK